MSRPTNQARLVMAQAIIVDLVSRLDEDTWAWAISDMDAPSFSHASDLREERRLGWSNEPIDSRRIGIVLRGYRRGGP